MTATQSQLDRSASWDKTPVVGGEISYALDHWTRECSSDHPHVYWGLSGATLLFEALKQSHRRTVVLPAFLCPELPAMAIRAGKQVIHIDVDRQTLLMNRDQLEHCLAAIGDEKTVLLVDHPFGYPCNVLPELRQRHPELLIVEDCVRALGTEVEDQPAGRIGDWVLYSLYKTIPGNDDGAVLLTRSPFAIGSGTPSRATLRQHLSRMGPVRFAYEAIKRLRPGGLDGRRERETIGWGPRPGLPSRLTLKNFGDEVTSLEDRAASRRRAAGEIRDALSHFEDIRFVRQGTRGAPSAYFLSFLVVGGKSRDELVKKLHRKGFFLVYAWNTVPSHYRCFRHTFPFGSSESDYLADRICHVPVQHYLNPRRRGQLIRRLRNILGDD